MNRLLPSLRSHTSSQNIREVLLDVERRVASGLFTQLRNEALPNATGMLVMMGGGEASEELLSLSCFATGQDEASSSPTSYRPLPAMVALTVWRSADGWEAPCWTGSRGVPSG